MGVAVRVITTTGAMDATFSCSAVGDEPIAAQRQAVFSLTGRRSRNVQAAAEELGSTSGGFFRLATRRLLRFVCPLNYSDREQGRRLEPGVPLGR